MLKGLSEDVYRFLKAGEFKVLASLQSFYGPQLTQRLSAFCGNEDCKSTGRGKEQSIAMTFILHPPIYNARLFTNIDIISGKSQSL